MFYPKLPPRAAFPAMLTALYEQRYGGLAVFHFRNGEVVRVSLAAHTIEIVTPAARPAPAAPAAPDDQAPEALAP